MLSEIIQAENDLKVKGYKEYGDTIRSYHSLPTQRLKKFLNYFTENYYDDFAYENLDEVVVEITKDYDLLISCWNEDYEQINDAVLIKINRNIRLLKLMLMSLEVV